MSGDQNITKPHVIGKMFYLYTHFHDISTSGNMTFFWYTTKLHEKWTNSDKMLKVNYSEFIQTITNVGLQ
jgi:hypothetical protein